jgi:hypothetical protein
MMDVSNYELPRVAGCTGATGRGTASAYRHFVTAEGPAGYHTAAMRQKQGD